jgi:hypothetical protein
MFLSGPGSGPCQPKHSLSQEGNEYFFLKFFMETKVAKMRKLYANSAFFEIRRI